MEMINPTEKLELLAASASEIHAASERGKVATNSNLLLFLLLHSKCH